MGTKFFYAKVESAGSVESVPPASIGTAATEATVAEAQAETAARPTATAALVLATQPQPTKKATKKAQIKVKDLEADPRFEIDPMSIVLLSEVLDGCPDSEIVIDFETTALTPWSADAKHGPNLVIGDTGIHIKEYAGTVDHRPRARILSVAIPDANYKAAFDLDAFSAEQKRDLAEALAGRVWLGHNLQFDYQWLLTLNPHIRPARIIDTMLLVAACRPEADIEMQGVIAEYTMRPAKEGETPRKCLEKLHAKVIERAEAKKEDEDGGAMPLQALSLWLLDEDMEKSYQKPHNWMLDKLSSGHYEYVMGDVTAPSIIARRLMKISDTASTAELLAAIDNHRGGQAYRVFEEAIHALVRMQRKGIRWDKQVAKSLDAELAQEAKAAAAELAQVAPSLAVPLVVEGKPTKKNPAPKPIQIDVLALLADPEKGMPNPVKKAIADALYRETGRSVAVSDAGNPILDAETLAFDFPGSRIVPALAAISAPTKARSMLDKFTGAAINERLHPLVSIKTKTGRTAAQEPSLQQVPRDPRFRAIFRASQGNKILATDYSSIELRIAAALGVRAWREFKSIVAWATSENREDANRSALPLYKNIRWLLKDGSGEIDESLLSWLSDDTLVEVPDRWQGVERPGRGSPIGDYRDYKLSQLCLWVSRIRKVSGGDEGKLPFIAAYRDGIDPHLLTASAMEAQSGNLDTGGLLPSVWIRTQDQQELKKRMKAARQAAKAVNFGSLYGQQAAGLHRYGATSFGLDWTVEDAARARDAWFALYPEIGLWHWLTQEAHKQKRDILDPYNPNAFSLRDDKETAPGKVYWGTTLSGRPTVSAKTTGALSFQDQGTGAEIALAAIGKLPEDVQGMLVNFVHDELVLEVPEARVDEVQAVVEKTMIEASDRYLLPFGVPTEVESAVGDCWIH